MRHAFAEEESGIVLKNHGAALTRVSHGTVVAPTPAPERPATDANHALPPYCTWPCSAFYGATGGRHWHWEWRLAPVSMWLELPYVSFVPPSTPGPPVGCFIDSGDANFAFSCVLMFYYWGHLTTQQSSCGCSIVVGEAAVHTISLKPRA